METLIVWSLKFFSRSRLIQFFMPKTQAMLNQLLFTYGGPLSCGRKTSHAPALHLPRVNRSWRSFLKSCCGVGSIAFSKIPTVKQEKVESGMQEARMP